MMRHQCWFVRAAMVALAIVLGGCWRTSTVRVDATELPALGTHEMNATKTWPELRTIDGKPWPMKGEIERVRIQHGDEMAYVAPPFTARIEDERLEVFSDNQRRTFALDAVRYVSIDYHDAKYARKVGGIVLTSFGGPCLPLGLLALWALRKVPPEPNVFDETGVRIGIALFVMHVALTAPGVYFLSTDPPTPARLRAAIRPQLHLGPGGVVLSGAF